MVPFHVQHGYLSSVSVSSETLTQSGSHIKKLFSHMAESPEVGQTSDLVDTLIQQFH